MPCLLSCNNHTQLGACILYACFNLIWLFIHLFLMKALVHMDWGFGRGCSFGADTSKRETSIANMTRTPRPRTQSLSQWLADRNAFNDTATKMWGSIGVWDELCYPCCWSTISQWGMATPPNLGYLVTPDQSLSKILNEERESKVTE